MRDFLHPRAPPCQPSTLPFVYGNSLTLDRVAAWFSSPLFECLVFEVAALAGYGDHLGVEVLRGNLKDQHT